MQDFSRHKYGNTRAVLFDRTLRRTQAQQLNPVGARRADGAAGEWREARCHAIDPITSLH
jgi:hypothetical protein